MKLIIAGSRTIQIEPYEINNIMEYFMLNPSEVVSGTARGVDLCGEAYAVTCGLPIKQFPADWETLGKSAGFIRNSYMAKYADALLLIWDGKSKGSSSMKILMEKLRKPVFEIVISFKNTEQ